MATPPRPRQKERPKPAPKAAGGATAANQGRLDRLWSWLVHHRSVAATSLLQLFDSWLASLMTWLVIGVALALPTILYLLLVNVGDVSSEWEGKPRLSVYLVADVDGAAGQRFADQLEEMEAIESAMFISADQALLEFQAMSGFGDVLASLDRNPLPALIEVVPALEQPSELRLLVVNLEKMAPVESVQVDLEWIERLFAILSLGQRFVAALGFFLALGVLLSIGNTIRLAIESRRSEIEVVKLVGGTDSFVRRPFLYLGFWYGFGGAILAWVMVEASLLVLSGPVDRLVRSYDDDFSLLGLGLNVTLLLWLIGAALGVLGAALAVGRHLHEIEPQ
ncbi:MAG: permease-like cell division protein FtsX [Pseudomonadales bacterium]